VSAPAVTVLVPVRNESHDIEACVRGIGAQTIGAARLELVLVDGASEDDTVARATRAAAACGFARVVVCENPARRTSAGLGVGLGEAGAPVLVRVDARSRIEPGYVARCVEVLAERPEVGVVGGAQVTVPRDDDLRSRAIARALNNRWLMGLARYRRSTTSGPADTVWMGAFRTAQLRAIGGWDPAMGINEDYELNERYRANGHVVWFEAGLRSGYLPRRSVRAVAAQYLAYGRAKGARWRRGSSLAGRHLVLLLAPPLGVVAYVLAARRTGVLPVVAIGAAGAAAADLAGGAGRAPLVERASALAVNLVIAGSWWSGALLGWLGTPSRTGAPRPDSITNAPDVPISSS
jgi:glycosyltransferase involved in cell wall biosynthesis